MEPIADPAPSAPDAHPPEAPASPPPAPIPDPTPIPPPSPTPPIEPSPAETPAAPTIPQVLPTAEAGPPPPPPFSPGVTVGDGGMAPPPSAQVFTPTVSGAAAPDSSSPAGPARRLLSKKVLIPVTAAILIIGGAAAFYFGYYTNPSVIYAQALSNTGKGYDKLVDYVDQQSQKDAKGYTGSGTYHIKTPDFSTDGKVAYKSDGDNSEASFDVGIGVSRVNFDIRSLKSIGNTPDIYLQAKGIKGLGDLAGQPDLNPELAKLDGRWIVIDHTLIDNLNQAKAGNNSKGMPSPSREQVTDEARAFGRVNQQYVFTTKKDKAVTKVVKTYGAETVDGAKTYHYQVILQKDNVKDYLRAQRDALKASKLNGWLTANNYSKDVYAGFDDAIKSADGIKSSDTYDIWVDAGHRIIYKVRVPDKPNPAVNYVELGLRYKGGDDYPFFIQGKSSSGTGVGTYSLVLDVNTRTAKTDFKFNYSVTGNDSGSFDGDISFQPTDQPIKIERPANAMSVMQVLDDFGLGSFVSAGNSTSTSTSPTVGSQAGTSQAVTLSHLQTASGLFQR